MTKETFIKSISIETGIPIEEIAGVYTDEEKRERLIFKRNQLINQLQRECHKIAESFDSIFEEEFKQMSSDISEILPLIFLGYKESNIDKNELLITLGDLLRNSVYTLISSVQILRNGFVLQSGILLRSTVEMCATVVHLLSEPNLLEKFLKDEIKSTKSISAADKIIPLFGRVWGVLSQKHIHINSLHTEWFPNKIFSTKDELPVSVTLDMIGVISMILRITTELAYFKYVDEHIYWEYQGENKFLFIPPKRR
jgi:hypothetical protein